MEKTVKLNIGGTIFETTRDTLSRSQYFSSLFNRWNRDDGETSLHETPYFIDRSAILFEHVLCLLRDPSYPFPPDNYSELDFYGIEYEKTIVKDLTDVNMQYCIKALVNLHVKKCVTDICSEIAIENDKCKYCNDAFTNKIVKSRFNVEFGIHSIVLYEGQLYYYKNYHETLCKITQVIGGYSKSYGPVEKSKVLPLKRDTVKEFCISYLLEKDKRVTDPEHDSFIINNIHYYKELLRIINGEERIEMEINKRKLYFDKKIPFV